MPISAEKASVLQQTAAMRRSAPLLLLLLAACANDPVDISKPRKADDEVLSEEPPASTPSNDDEQPAPPPPPEPELEVHSLANIGDSISQGYDADDAKPINVNKVIENPGSQFHDIPALSWIQGSDERIGSVASHYRKKDDKLTITPVSRSGAELVRDFEKQARSIAEKGAKPDLVFVLLGGNDVCNRPRSTTNDATSTMYSVDEWRTAAIKGLTALAEGLPAGATVRVMSMPRVDLLFEALGSASVPVVYNSPAGEISAEATCKDLWNLTASQGNGICKIVTTETSAEKRKQIGDRIDEYNTALAEEVRRFETDTKANPKKIRFQSDWHGSLDSGQTPNSSVGTYKFTQAEVSKLDCFHPSIAGQQALAKHALTKANWKP